MDASLKVLHLRDHYLSAVAHVFDYPLLVVLLLVEALEDGGVKVLRRMVERISLVEAVVLQALDDQVVDVGVVVHLVRPMDHMPLLDALLVEILRLGNVLSHASHSPKLHLIVPLALQDLLEQGLNSLHGTNL